MTISVQNFERFSAEAEPKLRRAFLGTLGTERMPDAVGEALAYAWEHWDRVSAMENPVGYVFRVGQSRTRPRKQPDVLAPPPRPDAHFEPGLPAALAALPHRQRAVVWLAHGCGWSHREIGEALGISASAVATHGARGLQRLRTELGVQIDA